MPCRRATRPTSAAGIDQAAIGRHMRDGDEAYAVVDHPLERCDVERAAVVAGHDLDDGAGAPRHLQEGDVVAGVLRARREDAIAGPERDRVERQVPGHGGVLDQRDLLTLAVDQAGDRIVDGLAAVVGGVGRLIAADGGFPLEMADLRLEHRRRHQRGAGVVEMQDLRRARSVAAGAREIDRHAVPRRRCGWLPPAAA